MFAKQYQFCIDTGAAISVLGREFLFLLDTMSIKPCYSTLHTANAGSIKVYGKVVLTFHIDSKLYTHEFVLTSLTQNFIGIDFLRKNRLLIDAVNGTLVDNIPKTTPVHTASSVSSPSPQTSLSDLSLDQPAVNQLIPTSPISTDGGSSILDLNDSTDSFNYCVSEDSDLHLPLHLCALTYEEREECKTLSNPCELNTNVYIPSKDLQIPTDAECPCPLVRDQVMTEFRERYASVFSGIISLEPRHNITLKIDLVDNFKRPYIYQVPYIYRKAVKERIDEMLEKKIIRPSSSEYANPITCAMKKDGTVRVCGDFRALNAVTRTDCFSLPRIDYIKRHIRGQVFSTLDLKDGFFQVPVDPESIPKTAIYTDWGLFEYLRMPFGLKNAPPTFQRLVNAVFHGLDEFMYVYIDDVIIFSDTVDEHIQHLDAVLQRMSQYGLVTQERKCNFFVTRIHYLGLEFDVNGYRPLPKLLPKIEEYPIPKDKRQVQKFLGLINYYRTHVPHLAQLAVPLYDLLRKTNKFVWTDLHQEAFDTLKKALALRLTLVPLTPDGSLVLQTDASTVACGAVLLQDGFPIEFFSRKFNQAEQRYSTFEREAAAMTSAIRHFRPILQGRYFEVQTDHKPLLKWKNKPPESERHARMIVKIQDLNFDITHIPGEQNNLADMLSRPPGEAVSSFQSLYNSLQINALHMSVLTDELAAEQTNEFINDIGISPDQIVEIDGFVYTLHTGKPRLIVPPNFRQNIIEMIHGVGHFGRKRTLRAVALSHWWPSINKDCANYVKYCQVCQRFKPTAKPKREYVSFPETSRFRTVHIDLVGPLKRTTRGYTSILTVMDRCSRWLEAYPMTSTTSFACAKRFINEWVSRFGVPDRIISDQGPQFESHLFNLVCNRLGIKRNRTTAWHPETNGALERAHGTLKNCLRCLSHATQDWDEALPIALLAMRTAINDSGTSPSLIVYGEQLAIPRAILDPTMSLYDEDMPHFVNQLFNNIQLIRDKLLNVPVVPNADAEHFIFPTEYAYLREPQVKASLEPKWLGPYPVVDVIYPVIRLRVDNFEKNVNIDLVKPAYLLNPNDGITDSENNSEVENIPDVDPDIGSELIQLNPSSQYQNLYQEVLSQPVGPQVHIDPISNFSITQ